MALPPAGLVTPEEEEFYSEYKEQLSGITANCDNADIRRLTIMAEDTRFAQGIVDIVCSHILEDRKDLKMPSLYLLDSIVKNVGGVYATLFSMRIVEVFVRSYKQSDSSTRQLMEKLFHIWERQSTFSSNVLDVIRSNVEFSPGAREARTSAAPILLPGSIASGGTGGIHVNPVFVQQLARQYPQQQQRGRALLGASEGPWPRSSVAAGSDIPRGVGAGGTRAASPTPQEELVEEEEEELDEEEEVEVVDVPSVGAASSSGSGLADEFGHPMNRGRGGGKELHPSVPLMADREPEAEAMMMRRNRPRNESAVGGRPVGDAPPSMYGRGGGSLPRWRGQGGRGGGLPQQGGDLMEDMEEIRREREMELRAKALARRSQHGPPAFMGDRNGGGDLGSYHHQHHRHHHYLRPPPPHLLQGFNRDHAHEHEHEHEHHRDHHHPRPLVPPGAPATTPPPLFDTVGSEESRLGGGPVFPWGGLMDLDGALTGPFGNGPPPPFRGRPPPPPPRHHHDYLPPVLVLPGNTGMLPDYPVAESSPVTPPLLGPGGSNSSRGEGSRNVGVSLVEPPDTSSTGAGGGGAGVGVPEWLKEKTARVKAHLARESATGGAGIAAEDARHHHRQQQQQHGHIIMPGTETAAAAAAAGMEGERLHEAQLWKQHGQQQQQQASSAAPPAVTVTAAQAKEWGAGGEGVLGLYQQYALPLTMVSSPSRVLKESDAALPLPPPPHPLPPLQQQQQLAPPHPSQLIMAALSEASRIAKGLVSSENSSRSQGGASSWSPSPLASSVGAAAAALQYGNGDLAAQLRPAASSSTPSGEPSSTTTAGLPASPPHPPHPVAPPGAAEAPAILQQQKLLQELLQRATQIVNSGKTKSEDQPSSTAIPAAAPPTISVQPPLPPGPPPTQQQANRLHEPSSFAREEGVLPLAQQQQQQQQAVRLAAATAAAGAGAPPARPPLPPGAPPLSTILRAAAPSPPPPVSALTGVSHPGSQGGGEGGPEATSTTAPANLNNLLSPDLISSLLSLGRLINSNSSSSSTLALPSSRPPLAFPTTGGASASTAAAAGPAQPLLAETNSSSALTSSTSPIPSSSSSAAAADGGGGAVASMPQQQPPPTAGAQLTHGVLATSSSSLTTPAPGGGIMIPSAGQQQQQQQQPLQMMMMMMQPPPVGAGPLPPPAVAAPFSARTPGAPTPPPPPMMMMGPMHGGGLMMPGVMGAAGNVPFHPMHQHQHQQQHRYGPPPRMWGMMPFVGPPQGPPAPQGLPSTFTGGGGGGGAAFAPSLVAGVANHRLVGPGEEGGAGGGIAGTSFRAEDLRSRQTGSHSIMLIINSLYGGVPHQCQSCGRRFETQVEYARHLDWHFTQNSRRKAHKTISRHWFGTVEEWLRGGSAAAPGGIGAGANPATAAEGGGGAMEPAFFWDASGASRAAVAMHNKEELGNEDSSVPVPEDESQRACPLCGESFDEFFSTEADRWMYKGAVYMATGRGGCTGATMEDGNGGGTGGGGGTSSSSHASREEELLGPIVHAKCWSLSAITTTQQNDKEKHTSKKVKLEDTAGGGAQQKRGLMQDKKGEEGTETCAKKERREEEDLFDSRRKRART